MNDVTITLPAETFARLQKLAVPLVDTIDSVLIRLLDHFQETPPAAPGTRRHILDMPVEREESKVFKTSRGVILPVMPLHARYDGKLINIQLTNRGFEWNGQRFDDPSSVAVAVKKSMGASDTTASTNGWTFWYVGDGTTEQPVVLDALRKEQRNIDGHSRRSLASRLA